MNKQEYLEKRVEEQITWYEKKSISNQDCHKYLRIMEIACAALIPFISGFNELIPNSSALVGLLGIMIAVSAGISSLNRYQENWISYRGTGETLKREKYRFLTKTSPYHTASAFEIFVQKIEDILANENSQWAENAKYEEVEDRT